MRQEGQVTYVPKAAHKSLVAQELLVCSTRVLETLQLYGDCINFYIS